MKRILSVIVFGFLSSVFVGAQPAEESETPKVIPTEISEPPYEVGDLPAELGYTIKREGKTSINFRIVEGKMRIYWLDEDKLIAEPEVNSATVRLTGLSTAKSSNRLTFHSPARLSGDAGLGSDKVLPQPNVFTVILVLGTLDNGEAESYTFRYNPSMNGPSETSGNP